MTVCDPIPAFRLIGGGSRIFGRLPSGELGEIDASWPLAEIKTMSEVIREGRSPKELMMWMMVVFGLIALVMAAVGTYAVIACSVAERTQEIGVRIPLGAQTSDVLRLVLKRGV
ncbi:MAG TPA: hypothetical protein VFV34_18795, partial [Blastocatellia bacterium]|nr:hypothetical protein [Blastocatellia bacterium]